MFCLPNAEVSKHGKDAAAEDVEEGNGLEESSTPDERSEEHIENNSEHKVTMSKFYGSTKIHGAVDTGREEEMDLNVSYPRREFSDSHFKRHAYTPSEVIDYSDHVSVYMNYFTTLLFVHFVDAI